MEELKLLIGMVADLPSMALWVVAFFFVYKVSIIGSIYGVFRLSIQRLYEYGISENAKSKTEIIRQEIHFEDLINKLTITGDDAKARLIVALHRIAGKKTGINSSYIHGCSVDWLNDAIAEKEQKEALIVKNKKC
jgi:hypothetical protein